MNSKQRRRFVRQWKDEMVLTTAIARLTSQLVPAIYTPAITARENYINAAVYHSYKIAKHAENHFFNGEAVSTKQWDKAFRASKKVVEARGVDTHRLRHF